MLRKKPKVLYSPYKTKYFMQKSNAQLNFFDSELPEFVRLRSGAVFQPEREHWKFVDGIYTVYMNFQDLPAQVSPLIESAKKVLIDFLEKNSPTYAVNMFRSFVRLAAVIASSTNTSVDVVTEAHILNFLALHKDRLGNDGQLSAFISRWDNLALLGISEDAKKLLEKVKKKGNKKGQAVLMLDPIEGPFTEFELQQLVHSLNQAYAKKRIAPKFFFLTWIAILTGQRISQYCALKVGDIVLGDDGNGAVTYEISIPKAKQRGAVIRDEFLVRPLLRQFGEALHNYAQEVKKEYRHLNDQAPLFPSDVNSGLEQLDSNFEGHWTPSSLAASYRKAMEGIAPISPRTSEPMRIAVGRFRDTLGTRAAQEGFGELVIAEILGHVDTQNVKCYVAVIPEVAQRLDRQLSSDLAPIANAFAGTIKISPSSGTRLDDPSSQIIDYKNSGESVGGCGTLYKCKFNAPIACYTCTSFEAWLDAPHAALYSQLEAEREVLLEVTGQRVAAVNDLTMIAIKNVMDECERIKNSLEDNVEASLEDSLGDTECE
jgi:integrase